jgi:SAM-dependent methyltransferase
VSQSSVGPGPATSLNELSGLLKAEPDGVIEEISPHDEMFVGNRRHYFEVGQGALELIRVALICAQSQDVRSILDLPSGHGRVLRHLKAAFPEAALTACDIERSGVNYCAELFGASPVYSEVDPDSVELHGPFDLIWCGSLLTHLDDGHWHQWLERFHDLLALGGLLVFTSHGRHTADAMRHPDRVLSPAGQSREYGITDSDIAAVLTSYDQTGFGFASYPGHDRFGVSASSPSWVLSELGARNFRVVTFIERGWDSHQDVVGCVREEI